MAAIQETTFGPLAEARYSQMYQRYVSQCASGHWVTLRTFCIERNVHYRGMLAWIGSTGRDLPGRSRRRSQRTEGRPPKSQEDAPAAPSSPKNTFVEALPPLSWRSNEAGIMQGVSIRFEDGARLELTSAPAMDVLMLMEVYKGRLAARRSEGGGAPCSD